MDKLLRPGGWLLFDDLTWKIEATDVHESERALAQVQEVFDLLVKGHPSYNRDGRRMGLGAQGEHAEPTVRTVVKRDLLAELQQAARAARYKLARSGTTARP